MKKCLFILQAIIFCGAWAIVNAQTLPVDTLTGKISYSAVVKVDSVSKDELFSRAIAWYSRTFQPGKGTLELCDRGIGLIRSSNNINFPAYITKDNGKTYEDGAIEFSIKINCKEGRFKYIISDFEHKDNDIDKKAKERICSAGPLENKDTYCFWAKDWQSLKKHADESIKVFIKDLVDSMSKQIVAQVSDDW